MKRFAVSCLLTALMLPCAAWAEDPVYFADASLKAAVEKALGVSNPTPSDMLRLTTSLGADYVSIASLVGLEYATNLRELDLPHNQITDLSPLSGLTNLQVLALQYNQISYVSPLSGLTNLQFLDLEDNQISDISALSGLTNLTYLYLYENRISDISALSGMRNLQGLELRGNPLDRQAYCIYLPQIDKNNPPLEHGEFNFYPNSNPPGRVSASDGIYPDRVRITWDALCPGPYHYDVFNYTVYRSTTLSGEKTAISGSLIDIQFEDTTAAPGVHYWYWVKSDMSGETYSDPDEGWRAPLQRTLTTSSTADGSVTTPGEGSFQYADGTLVSVAATAEANHHFVNWTGTAVDAGKVSSSTSASTTVTMDADYTLIANFAIDRHTLAVSSTAGGSVSLPGVGSFEYDHNTSAPIIAVAQANYHFTGWAGTAVTAGRVANPASDSTTITVDGDYTLQANFVIDQRTLVVSTTSGGTVSAPGLGSFQYPHGSTVVVAATVGGGYHFGRWTGTAVEGGKVADPSLASTTVTMDADCTLQANFAINTYTLTISATNGSVSRTPNKSAYTHGETVSLQATANTGYHFVGWSGDLSGSTNPVTISMDGNKTITANFAVNPWTLTISSTAGGSVISPGEGAFQYNPGEQVALQAQADPLFRFVGWRGGIFSSSNPDSVTMNADYTVKACFESVLDVLYVDDNAPGDPGPGDPNISDPQENGTQEHPFDMIQEAIDVAKQGAKVIVRPGTYLETIDLLGKSIEVNGLNSDDSNIVAFPIINGRGKDTVVRCTQREDPNCILAGFVITGGRGRLAGGILCAGSRPSIMNCLIVGNRATALDGGGGIYCQDSNAVFLNCTIAGNYGNAKGACLWFKDSQAVVTNTIVWDNGPAEMLASGLLQPVIVYTDVAGGWAGVGNLNADPLFAKPGYWADPNDLTTAMAPSYPAAVWVHGDYHLMSKAGRWDPAAGVWVQDMLTSPCIDTGDPNSPIRQEPLPNGNRVNMGAYGGTSQASKSPGK